MSDSERGHPTDPEVMECPVGYYARLHREGRAAYDEGPVGWVVPGYDELLELSKDHATFSNEFLGSDGMTLMGVSPEPYSPEVAELVESLHPMANVLFISDPPTHTRTRALAVKALNAREIRRLEPTIQAIADRLVDGFVDAGECDLVEQFAVPLPANLMGELLGIDAADIEDFKRWSDHATVGFGSMLDNEQRLAVGRSLREFQAYILERVAQRREQPTDDLLSAIVHAELDLDDLRAEGVAADGPRRLDDAEILALVIQLLAGGNHTTTDLVAAAMLRLIQNPDAMADVRADPELIPNALEETLRMESPVQCSYKLTKRAVRLGDAEIPAGAMVAATWGAAGYDPDVFADPERFDIHRPNARKHLSFGHGIHFCVGATMARTEARIAIATLLGRLQEIRLADGAMLEHEPTFNLNTLRSLPVVFRAAG